MAKRVHDTLAAATAATLAITSGDTDRFRAVKITNHTSGTMAYATVGGTGDDAPAAAAVEGDDTFAVPGGESVEIDLSNDDLSGFQDAVTVSIISAGTPAVSVEGVE